MCEQQLDLFSSAGVQAERPLPLSIELRPAATVLDDQALIAAIPDSNLADSIALAAEAGRRRLAAAVPSLETLCRRFSGFGLDRMVPEQAAALQALAVISGREAAQVVSQLIVRGVVQGPALNLAVSTAARIASRPETDHVDKCPALAQGKRERAPLRKTGPPTKETPVNVCRNRSPQPSPHSPSSEAKPQARAQTVQYCTPARLFCVAAPADRGLGFGA